MTPTFKHKSGFTLAETLITLAIIGIIAALTIPNLMRKYQKHVTLTGFKQAYSILTNAYARAVAENGNIDTWATINDNPFPEGETDRDKVAAEYFEPYLNIEKICGNNTNQCWKKKQYAKNKQIERSVSAGGYNYQLKNGMLIRFRNWANKTDYLNIIVDINGNNGPNAMGYDVFFFIIPNRPTTAQHKKISGYGYPEGRENYKNAFYGCNDAGGYGGYGCAALIINDGFIIADDYNW